MISQVTDYPAWWTALTTLEKVSLLQRIGARFGLKQVISDSVVARFDALPVETQAHLKIVVTQGACAA
ncbi:MAG TPA: hypothetical protein VGQ87_01740 [Patescibacteria group bacterium]|jgi:hypothetical protein|nr:hypothetical protein [Patescibacteria group bacterium]